MRCEPVIAITKVLQYKPLLSAHFANPTTLLLSLIEGQDECSTTKLNSFLKTMIEFLKGKLTIEQGNFLFLNRILA